MLVAVYGTLRAGFGNHSLLKDAPLVDDGLTVQEFTMLSSGFPVCLSDDDSGLAKTRIVVEVYDLERSSAPAAILRHLDSLEGHPDWYERKCIPIQMSDGTELQAWMYIMPGTKDDFPGWAYVPSGDFKEHRRVYVGRQG